ncbi:hypothetical protein GNP81_16305 [Aliivibrio fischeri]|uniref:hypothetical protein n=1 Tax=Aliivibrio fischeri TaxID=668 RepID=UPI0012D8AF08|nr:hypothetical protein [Aliivibrio fischeri]MUK62731.1 hypothetical protein [Aliivibrio fischeri]MUL22369.1 hypothetical protein [Aliivibrio fischeri]MUL26160.1 hypothetical protein [Aliivibrio fischeri]
MLLTDLINEVQRQVGRNIILFQQLEGLLKHILTFQEIDGHISELQDIIEFKRASLSKQTMGQLVGQFTENNNQNESIRSDNDHKEPHISFKFWVDNEEFYLNKNKSLSKLVQERNKLVHHLLLELDLKSIDSCEHISKGLDIQCEHIRSEINATQSFIKALADCKKTMSEFISSDVYKQELIIQVLQLNSLVLMLAKIAKEATRKDGWTLLHSASYLLKKHEPEEWESLRKSTEFKSLKSLMLKTELFEFSEEKTSKGGIRVLYKLKTDSGLAYA